MKSDCGNKAIGKEVFKVKKEGVSDSLRERALRALPEGAVPDTMDIQRCGLQTVVREDAHKVR